MPSTDFTDRTYISGQFDNLKSGAYFQFRVKIILDTNRRMDVFNHKTVAATTRYLRTKDSGWSLVASPGAPKIEPPVPCWDLSINAIDPDKMEGAVIDAWARFNKAYEIIEEFKTQRESWDNPALPDPLHGGAV